MLDKNKLMNPLGELLWLKVILFFTIVLLLMAVLYTNENYKDINRNLNEVNRATQTIRELNTLETDIYRTESLVRLFVLTHDYTLLKNEYDHTEKIDRVKELLIANPAMIPDVDSLNQLIAGRFVMWNKLINESKTDPKGEYGDMVVKGNTITQHILDMTGKIKETESQVLDANSRDTRNGVKTMTMLVIVAILFSIGLFLFAFFKLTNQIKREALIHEQLQRKNQELDRSNKELEQFAYVASHDLQEPLRKIHAYSGRLIAHEKENLSIEGREIIDKLQSFAQRMQRLIDDLLTFSRILQHTMQKKTVDLNKILNDTKQTMSAAIASSGIDITADALPTVMGYESQLLQLFQNLISNAIKYKSPDHLPRISIKLSTVYGRDIPNAKAIDSDKRFHKLLFSDNGIGFDNVNAEKIFVIFQRLHGRSEYEGTGIGLAICKLVTQNHEGYIAAKGEEEKGADFIIFLPMA